MQPLCTPTEPALAELSGLATDGKHAFAVADGGQRLEVFVLDPASCRTVDVITAEVNPYDVEDLALSADGALWLADTGDNDLDRETVALHRLSPGGHATLFRLSYPDGPHDAEALLLDGSGVPHLVTKEPLGVAGVYRPAGPLIAPGPTPLQRVAVVRLGATDTPGGPAGAAGLVLVTGGAVGATVLALRTYTDAYLYPAPDGDVLAALTREPVRIPLPGEPQGEAIALAPDGTLLSASESGAAGAPIRAVPGAAGLVPAPPTTPPVTRHPEAPGDAPDAGMGAAGTVPPWQVVVLAGAIAAGLVLLTRRRRG